MTADHLAADTVRTKIADALDFARRHGFATAIDPEISLRSTWSAQAEADRIVEMFAARHAAEIAALNGNRLTEPTWIVYSDDGQEPCRADSAASAHNLARAKAKLSGAWRVAEIRHTYTVYPDGFVHCAAAITGQAAFAEQFSATPPAATVYVVADKDGVHGVYASRDDAETHDDGDISEWTLEPQPGAEQSPETAAEMCERVAQAFATANVAYNATPDPLRDAQQAATVPSTVYLPDGRILRGEAEIAAYEADERKWEAFRAERQAEAQVPDPVDGYDDAFVHRILSAKVSGEPISGDELQAQLDALADEIEFRPDEITGFKPGHRPFGTAFQKRLAKFFGRRGGAA